MTKIERTPSSAKEQTNSFTEELNASERWKNWNAEVQFTNNSTTDIKALAVELHKKDDIHSVNEYENIITASFQAHIKGEDLAEETKISTLWSHLQANGCDQLRVIDGCLAVYGNGKELQISNLLKPEPLQLKRAAQELYERTRPQIMNKSMQERMAFMEEINLPPFRIS